MFPDRPKLIFQNDKDEPPFDCDETTTVNALFDLMNLNQNTELTDALIVHFIDEIKAKYAKYTVSDQLLSIDSYKMIASYSLADEMPEDILKFIEFFQSNRKNKTRLLLRHKNYLLKITSTFFYHKLRQLIETKFHTLECYDTMNPEINYSGLLSICHHSREAFQFFYKHTARKMIKYNFPERVQLFLNDFLFDIRLRKEALDQFFQMYEDELYNYVLILHEVVYNTGHDDKAQQRNTETKLNYVVLDLLNHLRETNFEHFVIVVTHFNDFLYLLKDAGNVSREY